MGGSIAKLLNEDLGVKLARASGQGKLHVNSEDSNFQTLLDLLFELRRFQTLAQSFNVSKWKRVVVRRSLSNTCCFIRDKAKITRHNYSSLSRGQAGECWTKRISALNLKVQQAYSKKIIGIFSYKNEAKSKSRLSYRSAKKDHFAYYGRLFITWSTSGSNPCSPLDPPSAGAGAIRDKVQAEMEDRNLENCHHILLPCV
ncbi:hypothetical protein CEXT_53281 [Caerostris extrusa]|uniref:Uncharacterized protein n=1 Tax=Caerostris extrusa TaxID=172846 RepID=A0AAV4XA68_CAEEX|nr:hypothetical protein CEXT_53281 [Caerostris extrusa]